MCCRKKANPLNLMNRDWKSERGREERREARRRARAMNSSPCSKETKCWKEKGDKQRWRERKGKKKRWSYPRRCKHNKKSKEKYQKKGGEKERGENEGSTRVNMRKSASAFSPSTQQAMRLETSALSFTHKYKGRTERHAHTRSCVRGACWKAPGVYKFMGSNPLRRRIIAEGYISQQRNALIRRVWSLPRLCVCLFLGWVHD